MKKEYKAPEMDVVEMDYENSLLCGSPGNPCSEPEVEQPFKGANGYSAGPLG